MSLIERLWRPIETVPHNIDVLVLMDDGGIDVANDGWSPGHYRQPMRGDPVWEPARSWWSPCHVGGYEWEWDYEARNIVGWMPLPSNESPFRTIIDGETK